MSKTHPHVHKVSRAHVGRVWVFTAVFRRFVRGKIRQKMQFLSYFWSQLSQSARDLFRE